MEYLGRIDQQVQIRGFRVELGEIENLLLRHDHIKDTVVIDRSDEQGDHYLCAYIVATDYAIQSRVLLDTPSLQNYLMKYLPSYMIPPYFVQLAQIPLTSNGKVDRKKLPLPLGSGAPEETYTAPRNKGETILAEIWQEVLGLERVGIDDNFFNVGGDSIKTIRLSSAINSRLNSHIKILDLYTHGTIRQLVTLLDRQEAFDRQYLLNKVTMEVEALKMRIFKQKPELADMIQDIYPMSDIEKGMVFYYMKNVGTGIYHDQFVYPIYYKDFDVKRFEQAINLMMEKHAILRTAFNLEDFEESVSIVYKRVPLAFTYVDLSQLPRVEQQRWLAGFLEQDRKTPFAASVAPLWRVGVFPLGEGNLTFTLVFHHAILDGWSTASLVTEVHNTYFELNTDPSYVPTRLKASYKDTVIEGLIEKQDPSSQEYWRKELLEYQRLEFSETTKSKSEMEAMTTYWHNAGPGLLEQLNHLADRYHTNLKNLCFGAYACFMNMFSYEDEVVVGVVTNNRAEKEDGDKVLGCFLNTVPVRLIIPRGITWRQYIQLVELKMLEVKKHERLSLFEIAVAIGEKSKDRNPIFDSLFNFMDFHIFRQVKPLVQEQKEKEDRGREPVFVSNSQDTNTLFDFEVDITRGTVRLCPKYNCSAISDETVKRCCGYFLNILQKYIEEPDGIVSNDAILSSEEKEQVLYQFNDTAVPYSREKTMHQLFEEQVLRSPARAAVFDRDGVVQWTYEELNKRSNRLAGVLRKKGLKPGGLAAVIMDRSIHLVAAVMGILKAGGAYVPLEPYLPDERIRKLLESLHIETVLVNEGQLHKVNRISQTLPNLTHLVCPDKCDKADKSLGNEIELLPGKELIGPKELEKESVTNPAPAAKPGDISYIIFTSGSTGAPKGVVETHRPVINVIEWVNKTFGVGYPDKLLFVASLGFDLSVYDIFGILATGASLRVVGTEDIKDPGTLLDIIMEEGITFWDSAPAALQQLVPFLSEVESYVEQSRLRLVFLSGDWIPVSMPDALREAFEGVEVISLGGATEATVWSNYYPIGEVDPSWPSIPYGKPIQNAKYYILDRNLEVCPLRVPGDLYIGGECLAVEYINDAVLSGHKFIANPFVPGEKMYRTGDMARWFEDGNMQFLGRKDQQVKIRGYRIELGEIESQLTSHPGVRDGIVLDRVDGAGNKYLCAYYVSKTKGEEIEREELKEYLLRELPEYMIPSYFIAIEKVPLTANGKLDRRGLPEPETSNESGVEYVAPENETQSKLVEIWSQVLGVEKEKIGINADFFELGGHSLKATTMAAKIHKALNLKISIADIFKTPTIKGLSEIIEGLEEDKFESIQICEKKEYYSLSYAQKRIYTALQLEADSTSYNIATILRLIGDLDGERLQDAFRQLIERHEILRTSFEIVGTEPVQRVHDNNSVEFVIEYRNLGEGITALKNHIHAFNLARAPLLRVFLSRTGDREYAMMLDVSHLIVDGVSFMLLAKDLMTLYNRQELPPLNIQYKDFSEWESRLFRTGYIKKKEDFWLDVFKGELPILELPTDFPRPSVRNVEAGATISVVLENEIKQKLDELIAETDSTLFSILLAVYNVLLNKYSGQEDFVVGSVVTGRTHEDLENVMGVFINMLPLRNRPNSGKSFRNFLEEVKENTFRALENQDYPMEELVKKLGIRTNPGRHPLFDTEFAVNNIEFEQIAISDLRMERYDSGINFAKFDLHFLAIDLNNSLSLILRYSTELFKRTTAEKIIEHFIEIIEQVVENPGIRIDDIEITIDFMSIKSNTLAIEQGDFNF
jgi:amino acid adenylation domain-containing protein